LSVAGRVLGMDSADSLRSPWLELLIIVVLAVSTLTLLGRPSVSSYVLVTHYLGVLEIISILYMAMLAGSLASAIENGYASALLQVAAPRSRVALGILASRVLSPLLVLTASSLTGFLLLLWDAMGMLGGPVAVGYASTLLELLGYGSAFTLIALWTRSSSKTVLLSLLLYLLVGIGGGAVTVLGLALSSKPLILLGLAGSPQEAAGVYAGYVDLGVVSSGDALLPLLLSTLGIGALTLAVPIYFERWFEA
jgi:hypothetical protein